MWIVIISVEFLISRLLGGKQIARHNPTISMRFEYNAFDWNCIQINREIRSMLRLELNARTRRQTHRQIDTYIYILGYI